MPNSTILLDHIETPILLLDGLKVGFANSAATELFGAHISGDDVRLAIRDPDAVLLFQSQDSGRITITGLSTRDSLWDLSCQRVGGNRRIVTLRDLSERASVARAHMDFVANASHELRTPLASVLGYVETLLDSKAGDDPKIRSRFLSTIDHEARRMLALIEDLMSLSRIEANKHERPETPVDLSAIVREVAESLGGDAPPAVTLPESPVLVAGDRGQLAQMVRNLADNARKYGTAAMPVRITLAKTVRGRAVLEIANAGDPIPPEHLPRLTERFYRVDESRSRGVGGTGLGLSLVKHIVERHRGQFDLSSSVRDGTVATVNLPLMASAPSPLS